MDQLCTSGIDDKTLAAGDEPAIGVSGDVRAAAGGGCSDYECNICLDAATEPVVTLCGHLYCWPCIYEWLRLDDGAADASNGATSSAWGPCPVCKAAVSPERLVPLYGRGGGSSRKPPRDSAIPRRPIVHREAVERQSDQSSHVGGHLHGNTGPRPPSQSLWSAHHHAAAAAGSGRARFGVLYPPPGPPPAGAGGSMFQSTSVDVLGGMAALAVLPWVSRDQAPAASASFEDPYMSPRLRRQRMEVERSLHQIWFFLVVFALLCLLLF